MITGWRLNIIGTNGHDVLILHLERLEDVPLHIQWMIDHEGPDSIGSVSLRPERDRSIR